MGNPYIEKDKLYTSSFNVATKHYPNIKTVSISITSSEKFEGTYARELRPSKELLWAYKNGEIDSSEYREWYRDTILKPLKAIDVYEKYRGKILCCWEKQGDFCHRHLIIEWLTEELADTVYGGEIG